MLLKVHNKELHMLLFYGVDDNRYYFISMSGYRKIIRYIMSLSARIKPTKVNIKLEATKLAEIMPNVKIDGHDDLTARGCKCEPAPNLEQYAKKKD